MAIATPEPQEPVQEPPEEETPEPEGVPVPVLGTLIETHEDTVNFSFIGDILFDGNYATGSTMSARGGFANCLDAGTRELMQSADVLEHGGGVPGEDVHLPREAGDRAVAERCRRRPRGACEQSRL